MEQAHLSRLKKVRAALHSTRATAYLETHLPNIYYLTGFTGDAGALLIEQRGATLFTDGRFTVQAKQEVNGAKVRIHRGAMIPAIAEFLRRRGKLKVGMAPSRLSLAAWNALRKDAGRSVTWTPLEGVVEGLRAVKDAEEIELIRDAARVGSEVMEATIRLVKPGVSELDIASEIGYRMRQKGASGESFEAIVAAGPRSALPHARPTERQIGKNELVVLDLGAILRRYCSDLTRTVYVGRAPARVRQWYAATLEALNAARDTVGPGVSCGAVDAAARNVLKHKGFGQYFVHSTGHGIGLEIHEDPRVARDQQRLLEAGNVITLEPGIYVEGVGGIRIEDDALVTSGGAEIITTPARDLIEI